jgi:hypothetical protein
MFLNLVIIINRYFFNIYLGFAACCSNWWSVVGSAAYRLPLTTYLLPLISYLLPLTAYGLPLTTYRLPLTVYRLPHF